MSEPIQAPIQVPIQVHVIDDDAAVRDSLDFLLMSAGLVARVYESPLAFLEIAAGLNSGCVVTDVRMPEMNGIDLVRRLQASGSRLPVIVITGHGDVPLAVEAMKVGARDFIEKPFDDEALLAAVRSALAPRAAGGAADPWAERLSDLSQRERQVLEGLVTGHANKVIARDLGISPRTVEIYRAKVMTKMGADSFAELIRMAIAAGVAPTAPGGA
jgi:two-component system response regulator FixJ